MILPLYTVRPVWETILGSYVGKYLLQLQEPTCTYTLCY